MEAGQSSTDVPLCPGCVERDRRIAQLEKRIDQLEKRLEELTRGGKRQAAPFSRGRPKSDPMRPGRKSGEEYGTKARRAIPPVIDEIHEVPLPEHCPDCGGRRFVDRRVDHQYQVEIPRRPIYRRFDIHIGRCACCGRRLQGRHPLQTSDALGCCVSQVGPEAQAAVVMLNKDLGLSQGKISRFFQGFFGIQLSRGGSCQIMLRAANRCEPAYQAIVQRVRQGPWIVGDETGWRIGGHNAWLHTAVGEQTVAYLIARERGFAVAGRLIGEDYAGKLIHDGYASYDRFWRATHQTCLGHLLRRCKELLETARAGAVVFPRKVKSLLRESLRMRDLRDGRRITSAEAVAGADQLRMRMMSLARPTKTHPANERLARHLYRHGDQLFSFLRWRGIDATNWRAEQAIRPAVVNRKVWGGNRTANGAAAQSILMSVLFTATKLRCDAMRFISRLLCSPPAHRPLLLPDTG
jgi:transposase